MKPKPWATLFLFVSGNALVGGWPVPSCAAEQPVLRVADTISDRAAPRIPAVAVSQIPEIRTVTPAQALRAVKREEGGERRDHVCTRVAGMIISGYNVSALALDPVERLDQANMLSANQSHILPAAELTREVFTSLECPQQDGMTLNRDCREAAAEDSPPASLHR